MDMLLYLGCYLDPTEANRRRFVNLRATSNNKHILSAVTGNINFYNISGVSDISTLFWNPPTLDPTVTFDCTASGNCNAMLMASGDSCPNPDGSIPDALI